jgi:Zn-dependent peptidase ImmA (M78 family)
MRSINTLETLAKNLLLKHSLYSAPVNISKLIRKEGVLRIEDEFSEDFLGAAFIEGDQKTIVINRRQGIKRKRFTLAHEQAHLVLHGDRAVNIDKEFSTTFFRSEHSIKNSDWREVEANRFAAVLLMPRELLEQEVRGLNDLTDGEIHLLSEKFKVSIMTMTIRLKSLGYL